MCKILYTLLYFIISHITAHSHITHKHTHAHNRHQALRSHRSDVWISEGKPNFPNAN